MSTFRVNKNVNYTVMSNHHLQDKRLSLKAKGLLSYMLSLPDDWDYSLKGLTVGCKDGLDSVRTAVLELEEHGYVRRQKVRNAKGQIIDYDYQVYESPVEDAPAVPGKEGGPSDPSATKSPKSRMKPCSSPFLDFPNLAEPNLEKATQQNTNKQNTKRQSTNLSGQTDESADFDQMEAQVREEFRERLEIDTLAQRYDPDKLEEIIKMKENDRRHIPHSLRPVAAVAAALAVNRPDPADPMDVLCKVGGLDIAAMTGFYLGCAFRKLPVLLDGAISCAAALCAVRLCPQAEKSLLASHRPAEPCGRLLLEALGLEPVLDAGLRLGEGTGAVAAMPLLDMALSVYGEMHTFDGLGIPAYRADGRSPEEGEP